VAASAAVWMEERRSTEDDASTMRAVGVAQPGATQPLWIEMEVPEVG
jgi:hypothetical protein